MSRVFTNGPGDLSSIPGRVIPKTLKMVLDTSLFNTQQYKVISRVKWRYPRKRGAPSPSPWCSSYWKGSLLVALDFGLQLYNLLYIYIYILVCVCVCMCVWNGNSCKESSKIIWIYTHTYTHTLTHIYTYRCVCVRVYASMCLCSCIIYRESSLFPVSLLTKNPLFLPNSLSIAHV